MERRDGGLPVDPVSGEQRRSSRADSLRLTRMPQIPRTPPPSGPGSAEAPGLPVSPPDVVRPEHSTRRRWPWVAAGVTLALAVPLGLIAAGRTGGRNPAEAAAPAPAIRAEEVTSTPDPAASTTAPPSATPSTPASSTTAGPSASASAPSASAPQPSKPTVTGKPNPSGANLALQGSATASASEGDPWLPANACDGDASTRWSSGFSDPQWIRVDLGRHWQLSEIVLVWERAYGVAYRVETSLDGRTWKRVYSTTAGTGGTVRIAANTVARHVRMYGTKRSGIYGYSLIELEIR